MGNGSTSQEQTPMGRVNMRGDRTAEQRAIWIPIDDRSYFPCQRINLTSFRQG